MAVDRPLEGMRVAIIATDGVEQSELADPRAALDRAGARTVLVAPKAGTIRARSQGKEGDEFPVDLTLDAANADAFDAVLLPGGTLNADKLRMEPRAREIVQRMDREHRPIAAICHAPWLLVSAGLVKGRRLTSYYTLQDDVRNAGGRWEDSEVVVDGNLVTSRQPKDIPAFSREMVGLFARHGAKLDAHDHVIRPR